MANILLIEDDPDILANLSEILSLAGYAVRTALNGKDGISLAREHRPDLVVSDIMMPGIDGFGVLHILKSDASTNSIPFIFLTSKHDHSDFRHAIHLGANDFIVKPFDTGDLLKAVENALAKNARPEVASNAVAGASVPPNGAASHVEPGERASMPDSPTHLRSINDALNLLKAAGETESYAKRHIVYKEESHPRYLYFINSGKIKAVRNHQDGKELIVDLYTVGDFMAYAPLIGGTPHIETAEVIEDCELTLIPGRIFEEQISREPVLMKYFLNKLSVDFIEKDQRLLGLAYNTLRKKVADALVIFEKKFHNDADGEFAVNIEREELASIAGTATESLIRTLYEFKNERLIEMKKGVITAIDAKKLEHLRR